MQTFIPNMKDLTTGNESKVIFSFALPMLLGNVFQQSYNIVDSIIVGNYLGEEALAAVGGSFPVIFVLISLVMGVSIGSTIIIAQFFGAKDFNNVKKAIDSLLIFLFFASLVLTMLGLIFAENIFRSMNMPEEIIPDAISYFNIMMYGMVIMFGFNAVSSILRGLGDSRTPLYFLIIATVLNIFLVILFVRYFGWGIKGSAIATVVAQGVSFILSIIYLNRFHDIIKFSFFDIKFHREIFLKSLKIGIPSGLQQTFVAFGMMALLRFVNGFGTDTIAAYTVAGRIDSFAMQPAMNFSMALSTFVGQNMGANKVDRVKNGYRATLLMTAVFSIVITFVAILFGSQIMSLFTDSGEVVSIGHSYLVIVCSFYILFSTMITTQGLIRGAGDTLIPMFITLMSLWLLRIPLSYVLSRAMGSDGIWWSIPIAWAFGMIASWIYYTTGKWKNKVVTRSIPRSEN
ncbi:MAG TPA: MATE family efflux transporter [Bacteroidales bacterium]|nr:MATE family efflux transporter [Bacteroidales bacterium]HNZ43816.1 MATE family efflux transporter [Bacteroidales bacterium]HPB26294.1 MATE family efflux transporter [Bacteroidales bacterium]HPI29389.1 MATE family efflux transporter [Bacteroidales bacterium]